MPMDIKPPSFVNFNLGDSQYIQGSEDGSVSEGDVESLPSRSRRGSEYDLSQLISAADFEINKTELRTEALHEIEDKIFDLLKTSCDDDTISVSKFIKSLESMGLSRHDPRLSEMMSKIAKKDEEGLSLGIDSTETKRYLNREDFIDCVHDNIMLIVKVFKNELVINGWKNFKEEIKDIYMRCRRNTSGRVAQWLPVLARSKANQFAVSICTIDGQRCNYGHCDVPLVLRACSRAFTYATVLDDMPTQMVHDFVGQEPSGLIQNAITLDNHRKPHNPMINSGSQVIVSLIRKDEPIADRFDYIYSKFKSLAGGEYVGFNNSAFLQEQHSADMQYAIAYHLNENKCFPFGTDLRQTLEFSFQINAIEATTKSASVMAATLANGGICPMTGERILQAESVRDSMSLMLSCGMYDYSGQFAFKVGLPAITCDSGLVMLVVPNVMGVAIWAPALDKYGCSCRGIQFCEELVRVFQFHRYDYDKNLACESGRSDPTLKLADIEMFSVVNLLFAAARGDVTSLQRFDLCGMDMEQTDYDGRTALHIASVEGHLNCVQFLVEKCAVDIDITDRFGFSPIGDARKFGKANVVAYLEEQLNAQNNNSTAAAATHAKTSTPKKPSLKVKKKASSTKKPGRRTDPTRRDSEQDGGSSSVTPTGKRSISVDSPPPLFTAGD